jgi:hypothetical protein
VPSPSAFAFAVLIVTRSSVRSPFVSASATDPNGSSAMAASSSGSPASLPSAVKSVL